MGIFPAADIGAIQASAVLTLFVREKAARFGGEEHTPAWDRSREFWFDFSVAKALFLFFLSWFLQPADEMTVEEPLKLEGLYPSPASVPESDFLPLELAGAGFMCVGALACIRSHVSSLASPPRPPPASLPLGRLGAY